MDAFGYDTVANHQRRITLFGYAQRINISTSFGSVVVTYPQSVHMSIDILGKIFYLGTVVQQIAPSYIFDRHMASPLRADNPLANVQPSVPVRNALRLYVSGACRTKKEASTAVGLHPNYLTMLTSPTNGSEPVKKLMGELEETLQDKTFDMSHLVQYVGRKAFLSAARLLDSQNERIILDAAKELMDRSPETQKTTKLQVDSFSLDGQDVTALVEALTESARFAAEHQHAAQGLIEVTDSEASTVPLQQTQATPEAVDANSPSSVS